MRGARLLALLLTGIIALLAQERAVDHIAHDAVRGEAAQAIGVTATRVEYLVMGRPAAKPQHTAGRGGVTQLPRRVYLAFINYRIAVTRNQIKASLAQNPDDFDGRDHLWQRHDRLHHRRGTA